MRLNMAADIREAEKMLTFVEREGLPRATTRSVNKTAKQVQSVAVKLIAKDVGITQKNVRKSMVFKRATSGSQRSVITAMGKRIPLMAMKARQVRRGITYRGQGGKRKSVEGAFITTMPKGHRSVFKRKGKARLPIVKLHGPSVPKIFVKDAVNRAMEITAKERWDINFAREMNFELYKARA